MPKVQVDVQTSLSVGLFDKRFRWMNFGARQLLHDGRRTLFCTNLQEFASSVAWLRELVWNLCPQTRSFGVPDNEN